MNPASDVRVRFAPSPTGHLHIGGLRSALFNWLYARHNKGTFLLRIEDTDPERSKKEYTDSILASFAWMDLNWDEPLVVQSERIERHRAIAAQLVREKKAYYCQCSQEQVHERLARHAGFDANFVKYDGFCRTKNINPTVDGPAALRFAIPESATTVEFDDMIRGHITIGTDQLDDFVIVRSDGTPMYNFVVVIDDADMRISHVIRGEEHIANTPKQILLYQACHFKLPLFAHLPMILGPDGNKLSKRDAATAVADYKTLGYLPEALFNYLVRLGWSHGDQEIFTRDEVIKLFTLESVGKKGAIFDPKKLDSVNGLYIRSMVKELLYETILKDICPALASDLPEWHQETILQAIDLYKPRQNTLVQLVTDIKHAYNTPASYHEAEKVTWIEEKTKDHLTQLQKLFNEASDFSSEHLSNLAKKWCIEQQLKIGVIAQPLRLALTGKSSGPGVFELMQILSKTKSIKRINAFIKYLEEKEGKHGNI